MIIAISIALVMSESTLYQLHINLPSWRPVLSEASGYLDDRC